MFLASRDGFTEEDFHRKCDGINNTVTIIYTDKNKIFGGYTKKKWGLDGWQKGDKEFLFSYNNNKLYFLKQNNSDGIFCKYNYGPYFGYNGFIVYEKFGLDRSLLKKYTDYEINEDNYAFAGEEIFKIKNYALYLIELG